jgi:flagellar biosynthesis protein FliR
MTKQSYILPYTILGLTTGCTLSYVTNKLEFALICTTCSIGLGLLRDANVENGESQNINNSVIKATSIYVLGPLAFISACGIGLAIAFKK